MLNNCLVTLQIIAKLMNRSVDRIDLPILYQNVEVHLQVPLGPSCYRVNQVALTGLWCTPCTIHPCVRVPPVPPAGVWCRV